MRLARLLPLLLPLCLGPWGCAGSPAADVTGEAPTVPAAPTAPTGTSAASAATARPPAPPPVLASSAERPAPPALRKGTVVLHVGDSFVHSGLTQRLRELWRPLDLRYEVRAEHSTNSLDWAKRMPELVASTQPDLVIVTLGGNEIGSKHLDVQGRAVERIVKAIGGRPCVWTTPPLWMEEAGLFDTIQAHVSPCRFFETDVVVGKFLPRRPDKIHPTAEGGAMWAEALHGWLMRERQSDAWALAKSPEIELTPRGRRGPLPP